MLALGKDFTRSVNRVPLGLLKGKVYTLLRTLAIIIINKNLLFVPTPTEILGVGKPNFLAKRVGKGVGSSVFHSTEGALYDKKASEPNQHIYAYVDVIFRL